MQNSPETIDIIIPAYNEARSLPELFARLEQVATSIRDRWTLRLVIVDDGSTDDTWSCLLDLKSSSTLPVSLLQLRKNFGQSTALQEGIVASQSDICVTMDADLQHFPEDIPLLLDALSEGADVVCGWRYARKEGLSRRWPSRLANQVLKRASGLSIHDFGTTFRAYRHEYIHELDIRRGFHRVIPALIHANGGRVTEVEIQNIERPHGKSNYGLSRTLRVLLDTLWIAYLTRFGERPLYFFGRVGLTSMALALIGLVALGVLNSLLSDFAADSFLTLYIFFIVLAVFGAQVFCLGLVTEQLMHRNAPNAHVSRIREISTDSTYQ